MIDVRKYDSLIYKRVKVTCIDGQIIIGKWIDWTSALDNEPDPESICVKRADGAQIEIFVEEIKEIEPTV